MKMINKKIKLVIILLFGLFVHAQTHAQESDRLKDRIFERLSRESGLSSNMAFDVLQDREGFYWITTLNGLNRFDGTVFRNHFYSKNDSQSLSHNVCNFLIEGNDGDIWVGTMKGVSRYSKRTGKFRRYMFHHPKRNDDILNRINGLVKDKDGNIWAASYGLWKIDPITDSIQLYLPEQEKLPVPDQVHQLFYDSTTNGCWFVGSEQLTYLDISKNKFSLNRQNSLNWVVFKQAFERPVISVTGKGILWVYDETKNLLHQFNPQSNNLTSNTLSFQNEVSCMLPHGKNQLLFGFDTNPSILVDLNNLNRDTIPYLANDAGGPAVRAVTRSYIDRDGNQWFCSSAGIPIAREKLPHTSVYLLKPDEFGYQHSIWSIASVGNSFWLGTKNGLFLFDKKTKRLQRVPGEQFDKDVRTIFRSGDSVLWISSRRKLTLLRLANQQIIKTVELPSYTYFVSSDKWGRHWVGTFAKGLFEFDSRGNLINEYTEKQGLASSYFISCFNEGDTVLWFGLNGGKGFDRFSLQTKKTENFLIRSDDNSPIEYNTINAITTDKEKNLWIGTYGGGVYQFNRNTNRFTGFRQSDGLSSDFVNTLAIDSTGNLWVSGFSGIDVLDKKSKEVFHVNEKMQYDNLDFINGFLRDEQGNFVFVSNGKIVVIDPNSYLRQEQEAKIIISSIKISNKELAGINTSEELILSYDQNNLAVDFSVIKISTSIPAVFANKLEGLEDNWTYSNGKGTVNYTNLPPGSYTLLLNATNEQGRWNQSALKIRFTINPPFWKTYWFYALVVVLIGFILFWAVRKRLSILRAQQLEQLRLVVATQEREKKIISAELHDDLGVRLSALKYFVTSLKSYLKPDNPQAEETYQKTIATIDESVEDVRYLLINLSPKTLNEYGYLVAVEDLVNKLTRLHIIEIVLSQKGLDTRLDLETEASLYRITQELINNTLKHAGANLATLSIERNADQIKLEYTDNGKGFDWKQSHGGYGIENIHTRVKLLKGKIEWESGHGKVTKVTILIPYNHTLV